MKSIGIRELADRTREAQQAKGLKLHTVWEHYITTFLPIVELHEKGGREQFDRTIIVNRSSFIPHVLRAGR